MEFVKSKKYQLVDVNDIIISGLVATVFDIIDVKGVPHVAFIIEDNQGGSRSFFEPVETDDEGNQEIVLDEMNEKLEFNVPCYAVVIKAAYPV